MILRALALLLLATAAAPVRSALLANKERRRLRSAPAGNRTTSDGKVLPLSVPDSETPIRVLISAFKDGERCANTLYRALLQAEHPERVSFSVLQALGPGDVNCLEEFTFRQLPELCPEQACRRETLSRVHFWTIPREEGKGPVHQRGLLSDRADLSGESSMCLSIDSHMDFAEAWDRDLLEDWSATENEFAVLTAYPQATWNGHRVGKRYWISLCGYFLQEGLPRGSTSVSMENGPEGGKPVLTMNWAAGQSFSRCHAERDVPPDKNLAWIFDGEEVNRAVRLWTHGYDLYNPSLSVILHNYTAASQEFWSYAPAGAGDAERLAGEARLEKLLHGRTAAGEFGRYGLGDQRSLEDYVAWSHTDLGGQWREFLLSRGFMPNLDGKTRKGDSEPESSPSFCEALERAPVRSAAELLARARGGAEGGASALA